MEQINNKIGNTPLVFKNHIENDKINLFFKLEYCNPTGSVKDRAASYVIEKLLEINAINQDTTIIESSSGNFGISLAAYCNAKRLKFICVVDPNITPINEFLIKSYGGKVIKVKNTDQSGGYLLSRLQTVKELRLEIENSYWINQYENKLMIESYFSLGSEICEDVGKIDYVFICVSSGGTISGVSTVIKCNFPNAKIIAVDIAGSVIFGEKPKKRNIPGIGSSIVPPIISHAYIDDVLIIDENTTISMCHKLLEDYCLFAGGSSGTVFGAINQYFKQRILKENVNVVAVLPDRGERYFNTIYNQDWCKVNIKYAYQTELIIKD